MPTLQLYDTLRGQKVPFEPITPGFVGMYVCGPTVYSPAHLGNCRTFVSFDVIYRTLLHLGNRVRYVRNITDVGHLLDDGEDRMSKGARAQQLEPMEVAQQHTVGFHDMLRSFNCLPPSIEPRATGHIPEQIEMVQEVLDAGLAYEAHGSVYFDVPAYIAKHGTYGALSGRKVDDLLAESRELKGQQEKRHPADFAIWMRAQEDVLQQWKSPWSEGFPGWHLECSAMSRKYLGETFDIHGGGNDLKFPHHENEIAQNEASCGHGGARYWLHTNMLLLNGKKMSKSDGNYITPEELFTGDSAHVSKGYAPMVVRFFFLQAHYGSPLDMSDAALAAAEKGYQRLMEAIKRAEGLAPSGKTGDAAPSGKTGDSAPSGKTDTALDAELSGLIDEAEAHLADDFNTPRALASLFEVVGIINALADGHRGLSEVSAASFAETLHRMRAIVTDVLGLTSATAGDTDTDVARLRGLMDLVLDLRAQSRQDRNWTIADKIRDRLAELEIEVKDGKEGTSYSLK